MKKLTNKNFIQKIVITIVIVLSFNFIAPPVSNAGFGGMLLEAALDLVAALGDAIMGGLEKFMVGRDDALSENGFVVEPSEFESNSAYSDFKETNGGTTIPIAETDLKDDYGIPTISYSPEKIFSNEVPGLDANFISPKFDGNSKSIAAQLQDTISSWYNALRNLVIVGLLSVLLYVGIRIVISSVTDKAKYKQMLMDWLIALCLLFFLHYIMSFTMTFIDIITEGVSGLTSVNISVGSTTFKTNLTGLCRMYVQSSDLAQKSLYLLFYIALIIYTCKFTWQYTKRAITIAFLTLMAPLVTLTYPIDKMGDGKSQAFNMWLKEYIFNALLQPFHLIIYGIFIGSAMDLVKENILYAILFLAFITPAEKLLRKFFGFDKSATAGASFAGGFGGAAAFNAVKGMVNKAASGKGGQGKGGQGKGGNDNVRTKKQLTDPNAPKGVSAFANNGNSNNSNENLNEESEANRTAQQRMADADLENNEYNAQEMDAIQREAYGGNNSMNYSASEYADILRDSGYDQSEIDEMVKEKYGAPTTSSVNPEDDQRGVLEWARDGWNNSQLKENLSNSKPVQFARKLGNGVESARNKVEKGIKKIPKPIRNTIRGVANVGKHAAIGGAKFAGRVAAAGAVGALGLAAGITGDDLDDVFKYAGAGAALGFTAGPAVASNIVSGIDSLGQNTRNHYEEGKYGRVQAALKEQDRQFRSNKDNQAFFAEAYEKKHGSKPTTSQLNATMRVASEYNNAGITDLKQIDKGMKLEEELRKQMENMPKEEATKNARDQAMTVMKIASEYTAQDLRNEKKVNEMRNSYTKELVSYGMSEREARSQSDRFVDMVKEQKGVH